MFSKAALSCVLDNSLPESRELEECIDNIQEVSIVRLDITEKVIDVKRKLENLEHKEKEYGY